MRPRSRASSGRQRPRRPLAPESCRHLDFGGKGKIVYAVMELLEGETLRDRLARRRSRGANRWRSRCRWRKAWRRGLRDVVHRDLKPENVFLTSDGRVRSQLWTGAARGALSLRPMGATAAALTQDTGQGAGRRNSGSSLRNRFCRRRGGSAADIFSSRAILKDVRWQTASV